MKIRIQNRQTGKTTDIIRQIVHDKGAIMIVPNQHFKKDLEIKHKIEGRVFTLNEVTAGALAGRHYSKVYIDEVGGCLDTIIPKIEYGTHTND